MTKPPAGKSSLIAYAVFEGGGAKGISHIAALKALEEQNIQLVGVAGTSAGAIVATLVAAGYSADELIDPNLDKTSWAENDEWNIFLRHQTTPVDLIGKKDWEEFRSVVKKFSDRPYFFGAKATFSYNIGFSPSWLQALLNQFGILGTEVAGKFLNDLLIAKVSKRTHVENDIVRFRHLSPTIKGNLPLKLVVTDIAHQSLVLIDSTDPQFGELVVSDVVIASMSIPFLFKPRPIDGLGQTFVDGGLVGNLPVWAFLEDRTALQRKLRLGTPISTIAFLSDGRNAAKTIGSLKEFALSVTWTGVFGSQRKAIELVPGIVPVELHSNLETTDFNPSREAAMAAFKMGFDRASAALEERMRRLPEEASRILRATLNMVKKAINNSTPGASQPVSTCRLALLYPVGRISVRVVASVNRSGDGDEDMVYDIDAPTAPAALRDKDVHHFSFANKNAEDLLMTPSEFARHRSRLNSLVAVPIFPSLADWELPVENRPPPAGILALDADFDLKPVITAGGIEDDLITQSVLLHPLLKKLQQSNGD
jgi:NTE family protein